MEMDFRQYDPAIARFTSIDPVVHYDFSTYTAFDNNPIFWADPSGADAETGTVFNSKFMNKNGGHWSDSFNNSGQNNEGSEEVVDDIFKGTPENGASITDFKSGESYKYKEGEIKNALEEGLGNKYEELPSFAELLKNYITYDKGTMEFGGIVGGKIKQNIDSKFFENTCALRVSHALNMSGHSIPLIKGQTSSSKSRKWYIFRVSILDAYMNNTFGPADIIDTRKSSFSGHQGVIMFKISRWSNATGHFTLWDGKNRIGGNYQTDFYFNNSSKVKLWKAK